MSGFLRGDTHGPARGMYFTSYGIHVSNPSTETEGSIGQHHNQIVVYGDEKLRDKILAMLQAGAFDEQSKRERFAVIKQEIERFLKEYI